MIAFDVRRLSEIAIGASRRVAGVRPPVADGGKADAGLPRMVLGLIER